MTMDTKYGIPYIDVSIEEEDAEVGCIELLKHLRPNWTGSDIETKIFTAGFMNRLVKCRLKSDEDDKDVVLVRVFGAGTKLIIDREVELLSIRILHAKGLAAPIFCRFKTGIAYGYTQGACLSADDMLNKDVQRLVCKELARFHSVDPNDVLKNLPDCAGATYDTDPYLFKRTYKFINILPDKFVTEEKDARFRKLAGSKEALIKEVEELESKLTKIGCKNAICHNDLLQNNIVLNKQRSAVSFIDFEEVYVNFIPFDIAAHFQEFAGIHGGYDPGLIPDDDFQRNWLRMYLEECAKLKGKTTQTVTDKEVETLFIQVKKFSLTHSLFAGVWCLIQVNFSIKDVDFMTAAEILLGMYYSRKESMLALKMPE